MLEQVQTALRDQCEEHPCLRPISTCLYRSSSGTLLPSKHQSQDGRAATKGGVKLAGGGGAPKARDLPSSFWRSVITGTLAESVCVMVTIERCNRYQP